MIATGRHHCAPHPLRSPRRFLKHLNVESRSFLLYITGISCESERSRYTTLMLLRLMTLYFLQQHGLLDGNPHYLSLQLQHVQEQHGEDNFYRAFLLPLFQALFNGQTSPSNAKLPADMGTLPRCCLPLFASHQPEREHPQIQIADEAFFRLFALFDRYDWQPGEQHGPESNTLSPTVLSDYFEQQINQKQFGAYYTSEDVPSYLCENTIILHLLEAVRVRYPSAFERGGSAWQLLREHPERYIKAALCWPEPLPLETQQEYELRLERASRLRERLLSGAFEQCADLVTNNLDLARFALDCIERCQQDALALAFYESLQELTVLDPTCGTGALLLAALHLLKSLYSACLRRLRILPHLSEEDGRAGQPFDPDVHILNTILSTNLYGVDLVEEAVDICTARLFLAALGHCPTSGDDLRTISTPATIRCGNALLGRVRAEDAAEEQGSTDSGYKNIGRFDWDLEFREVMQHGGFSVIIGNPPYIEYSTVRRNALVANGELSNCGNLYAAIIERALRLCKPGNSHLGLIVPLSICGSERFTRLRSTMSDELGALWLANFDIFPCRLFEDAFQRLTILLGAHDTSRKCAMHVTKIQRWNAPERPRLIALLHYTPVTHSILPGVFPKLASRQHEQLLRKIQQRAEGHTLGERLHPRTTHTFVYYQEATNYWIKAVCKMPYYKKNGIAMKPPHGRFLYLEDESTARIIMAIMNSSLFYTWFATFSDGFHLAHALVRDFPLARDLSPLLELDAYARRLEQEIATYARRSTRNTRPQREARQPAHLIELEEYRMRYCKPLLDEIDAILARYYDFTKEELECVISYDRKYRVGQDG